MFTHTYNTNDTRDHGSIYEINRRQEREIKGLKSETTRLRGCMDRLQGCVATTERDLRKARRTIEMQEAQMKNMQKENAHLREKKSARCCEVELVMRQSDNIKALQAEVKHLNEVIKELRDNSNHSSSNTWVPMERYEKLEAKKELFKKALAAELDGQPSSDIIDILTEEAPKKNCELISIRHSNPMWW